MLKEAKQTFNHSSNTNNILDHSLLATHLSTLKIKDPFFLFDELGSTQDEVARRLTTMDPPAPFAVITKKQTKGRGRRGKAWEGTSHNNLYISFGFKPNLAGHLLQTFSLWIGLHICHFLNTSLLIPIKIKWPNDLILQGKKVAGFLVESRIDAEQTRDLILGLGLNINGKSSNFPTDLQHKITTLEAFNNTPLDINLLTAHLIQTIFQSYYAFVNGKTHPFHGLWTKYDYLKDQPITVYQEEKIFQGIANGIDQSGNLILQFPNGTVKCFHTAEVTLSQPL